MALVEKQILIKIHHVLQNDLFLIFEGFAVFVLFVESVQGLSDYHSDIVSYLCPNVTVNLSSHGYSFEDLILGDHIRQVAIFLIPFTLAFSPA